MENKFMILIVEDEKNIMDFLAAVLQSNGYQIRKALTGKEGLSMVTSYNPDLILLDLGLPDIDGLEVLKQIRKWSEVPILVVSAREQAREKVEALDLGADDYITKPFNTTELLARIRTSLRRSLKQMNHDSFPSGSFSIGNLTIDYEKRRVFIEKEEIHFTPIEYKIVVLLSKYVGKVLTHDFMIKAIWGPYVNENRTLRVNMANIRRKIENNPAEPRYILTEIGVGYRMEDEWYDCYLKNDK